MIYRILGGVLLLMLGLGAEASPRVALVIGNGAYEHVAKLPNPANDAAAMTRTLKGMGFQVTEVLDAGKSAMERGVLQFARQVGGAEVALVYYAGHGMQVDGRNYLIPVDARLEDDLTLQVEAINLELLLNSVAQAQTRLIFMDACRDNPFSRRMRVSGASRSIGRGLARIESAAGGTLIAFATDPDNVAADGDGRNSPFATALLQYLPQPGLEIRQVMGRVRQAVASATNRRQIPWENSSLFGDLYLAGGGSVAAVATAAAFDPRAADLAYWQGALAAGTEAAYRDYLRQHPGGQFAAQAEIQLAALSRRAEAAIPSKTRPSTDAVSDRHSEVVLNVVYGQAKNQKLDIYVPASGEDVPVIIFFAGRAKDSKDKRAYEKVGQLLSSRGFLTMVVNSRASSESSHYASSGDGALAVHWARANAIRYHGSPQKLFLGGHASGASTAAMLALNEQLMSSVGGSRKWLSGMVGLAGIYDSASIETILDGHNAPMLLMHGEDDRIAGVQKTRNFAQLIAKSGGKIETIIYPILSHERILSLDNYDFFTELDSFVKRNINYN